MIGDWISSTLNGPLIAAITGLVVMIAAIVVAVLRHKPKSEPKPPTEARKPRAEPGKPLPPPSPEPDAHAPDVQSLDDAETEALDAPSSYEMERMEERSTLDSPPLEKMEAEPRASAAPESAPTIGSENSDHYAVTVHYGTDRRDSQSHDAQARFTDERARPPRGASPITYGSCQVTIPKSHKVGGLEAPWWFDWSGEQTDKHVILQGLTTTDRDDFLRNLSQAMNDRKSAFVFVHGFSVSFEDAARRTAQMAFDMKFPGAPIFFSWPTEIFGVTKPLAYSEAENNARWATEHFRAFLADVIQKTGAETVHLIAHSMGNRVVADALMQLHWTLTPEEKAVIGEVILTAPDIDADVFVDQIAPRIQQMDARMTLYTSSEDEALATSHTVHGYPRAGTFAALSHLPDGVDVIDASNVETGDHGHTYYGDSQSVMSDICHLMVSGLPANERALTLSSLTSPANQTYWSVREATTIEQVWVALVDGGHTRNV
ncbi:MAG: esterase/lipase superfamily enzyme [Hyphomicrobiaceae bacterium]